MFSPSRSEGRIISDIILKLYADEVKFHHRKNKEHMIHKYYPYDIKDEIKFTREEKKHLTIARIFFEQAKTLFYFRRRIEEIEKNSPSSPEVIEIKKVFDNFRKDFNDSFGNPINPDNINTTGTVPLSSNKEYNWWVEIYDSQETMEEFYENQTKRLHPELYEEND